MVYEAFIKLTMCFIPLMNRLGSLPPPTFPSSRPRLPNDVVLLVNSPPCFFPPLEDDRDCILVRSCCVGEVPFVSLVSIFASGGGPKSKGLLPLDCFDISILIWALMSLVMWCCVHRARAISCFRFFLYCVRTVCVEFVSIRSQNLWYRPFFSCSVDNKMLMFWRWRTIVRPPLGRYSNFRPLRLQIIFH